MAYLGTKPANQIIDSTLIADGAVSTNDLANGAVTDAKIASGAINTQALSLLNASGSAPVYAARAWVNFNGTGTVAIRASGNVSSITDNGVGAYAVNFATAMPDANYSVNGSVGDSSGSASGCWLSTGFNINGYNASQTVSSCRIQVYYTTSNVADVNQISVGIFC